MCVCEVAGVCGSPDDPSDMCWCLNLAPPSMRESQVLFIDSFEGSLWGHAGMGCVDIRLCFQRGGQPGKRTLALNKATSRVWLYGVGPAPPAHIRVCVSH